jgi:MHS family proline/betaine transporter-like MFS transporter
MIVIISLGAMAGGSFAILFSKVIIDSTGNWRYIFLAGSIIAFFGLIFRTKLRETNEYIDATKRLPKDQHIDRPIDKKLLLSYFVMRCIYPFSLYLSFSYAPLILKQKYGYDISDILSQNLIVTALD